MAKRSLKKLQDEEAKVKYFKPQDLRITLTDIQKPIINQFIQNQYITLIGDPGTGKTTLALYYAVKQLLNKEFEKIVISKNIVQTGADMGFLPGDIKEKTDPYKDSFIDVVAKLTGNLKANELFRTNQICFEPTAFIRGKTIDNAVILVDEVQNMDLQTIMSWISRASESSKIILMGDETQADIRRSGLEEYMRLQEGVDGVVHIELGDEFQMRSPRLVEMWKRYKEYLKAKKSEKGGVIPFVPKSERLTV